ncbi:2'-5' RNA ligase family protein [Lactococcus protaetiae]|uniref:2'-5' RNA ligase family protein n=1 Tax=Lactococcus protaetiae TaxID=2592653 RepID=A0A514Z6P6_9LACT|nr:2'-5' RNA ligase family protein [Lactococcus protaetiae]QDK70279.1 2'-5' RNA ligase family protein [Lactococcus protaetiae]
MDYSLVLKFDDAFNEFIQSVWNIFEKTHLSTYHLDKAGYFPHVTLESALTQEDISSIKDSMDNIGLKSFYVVFDKISIFPHSDTLTLQLSDDRIIAFRNNLRKELSFTGVENPMFPYVPHLTLMNHQGLQAANVGKSMLSNQLIPSGFAVEIALIELSNKTSDIKIIKKVSLN